MITSAEAESRSHIEPTPDEMLAISQEIALKFSPNESFLADVFPCQRASAAVSASLAVAVADELQETKNFGYRELQGICENISLRFKPQAWGAAPELLLLPVDPYHLYAFWSSGSSQPSAPERGLEKPLNLRIYWQPDPKQEITSLNLHFDVSADQPINRKKIRLPIDDTYYAAVLGRQNPDHSLEVLTRSNLVHVPAIPGKGRIEMQAAQQEPMEVEEPMRLSSPGLDPDRQRKEYPYFYENVPMQANGGTRPNLTTDITKLYAELMESLNEIVPDSGQAATLTPEAHLRQASGRGL